ncbi:hypothetical protein DI272_38515 [Streptomyces sp. Act143]|uniref:CD3072 family TudS-related putative desulfidase n=1 Tax=Streptomyces sp. Act143 TaxID=2200760 RepID=UPI000D673546|nr:CD3072 family TudS-related putative desulfidase [Streptomyces sp. Act143]PWI19398.1 hypothetical protein DI272_38515 [Streptomyces sp. Act143]
MYSDARSKRVVLVSHCILNANSLSDGTADYPAVNSDIVQLLARSDIGIIQMPCPELMCLGLDRGDVRGAERHVVVENTRIRAELEKPSTHRMLMSYVDQVTFQAEQYVTAGFDLLGIIGVDRSPSCGVNTTSKGGREVAGQGVFVESLQAALHEKGISVRLVGTKGRRTEEALRMIKDMIDGT